MKFYIICTRKSIIQRSLLCNFIKRKPVSFRSLIHYCELLFFLYEYFSVSLLKIDTNDLLPIDRIYSYILLIEHTFQRFVFISRRMRNVWCDDEVIKYRITWLVASDLLHMVLKFDEQETLWKPVEVAEDLFYMIFLIVDLDV